MGVQTAGSSNPQAGPEGQITGLRNADLFRDRMFAARDALIGNGGLPPPSEPGAVVFASKPFAPHSMQYPNGSLELQQLQEINAGIKQVRINNHGMNFTSHAHGPLLGALHSDFCDAVGGPATVSIRRKMSREVVNRARFLTT
jgi:hypothetical protein